MKGIVVLGSTGSIGRNALEVIRRLPKHFKIIGLSANSNTSLLEKQIDEFRPELVCIGDKAACKKMALKQGSRKPKILSGDQGLKELVRGKRIDKVLLAISGSSALGPLLEAVRSGKEIALANKEALVMAGPIIMEEARKSRAKIIPIDSEQSAIWQCLDSEDASKLKNIYLTASGGPFADKKVKELHSVSVAQVLRHPRWKMGKKITVDSATLMNKGLELLEAMFLFNCPSAKIKVVIHPEAIIHSMVEFIDGVVMAQLSLTDMRIPIQYALTYPERMECRLPALDFYSLKNLHFSRPDLNRFSCLRLAYRAAGELGTVPAVLNAANEIAVSEFLNRRIGFLSIPRVIESVLDKHKKISHPDLSQIGEADIWGRQEAHKIIGGLN